MIQTIELGEPGRQYIAGHLEGIAGWAGAIAATVRQTGSVIGVVPAGTSLIRAIELEVGGLSRSYEPDEWVEDHLQSLPAGYLLLQDIWAMPVDAARTRGEVAHGTVYHYLRSEESRGTLRESFRKIISFYQVVAYLPAPHDPASSIADLLKESPEQLAAWTQELFMCAYDQEAYVGWSRTGR